MVSDVFNVERILNSFVDDRLSKMNTCTVGIITNTQYIKDGFVTVKPLINQQGYNLEGIESAEISFVPIIMPSTSTCGMVIPIKKGDTCLVVFGKQDFSPFKMGSDTPHDPMDFRKFSDSNAVAFIGFNTMQNSVWNPKNHSETYSDTSVKIYNNKGTSSECFIEMKEDGVIDAFSPVEINANAPVVNADDVVIRGVGSVKQFMLTHTHNYTDDNSPMVTAPPNIS